MKTMRLNRRKIGGGALVVTGLIALIIPFLLFYNIQPVTTPPPPPPPAGNNHGGNGGTRPSCTINCARSTDNQPPVTAIKITGQIEWSRGSIPFYYPNFTVTLHAVDDENLSSIILNDTGTMSTFHAHGLTSSTTITITMNGLHTLSYYSIDKAGNKEIPHQAVVGLTKPDLSDIQVLITNSGLDNPGIKNALTEKVETAQDQLAKSQSPDALNALSNQLNALAGKHGLDQGQADLMQLMISAITG
jgi:hypothetical protein